VKKSSIIASACLMVIGILFLSACEKAYSEQDMIEIAADSYELGYLEGQLAASEPGYDDGYYDGYQDGYDRGSMDAYDEGYNQGFNDGESLGYESGYQNGFWAGEDEASGAYSTIAQGNYDQGYLEGYYDCLEGCSDYFEELQ
jgi:flagellar biosynthesis/type III secretory pathway protein FliH